MTVVQIGTVEVRVRRPGLPRAVFGFVGRAGELRRIAELAAGADRALQVCGRPGSGKTALAIEAAHAMAGRFAGGAVAVGLHGFDGTRPPTAYELLGEVLQAVGVPDRDVPTDPAARAARYRDELAGRRVLVLADDAATPAQVAALLPPPGSFLLVTTRARLPGMPAVAVGGLDPADAVALLRAARPGADVDALVAVCAGLPLALRIVAARLAVEADLPVAELAARLAGDGARLGELSVGDRAVRAAFRVSYDRVGDDARRAFRHCAALPLAHVTAPVVAASSGWDIERAAAALAGLAAAHLVDDAGPGRHRLHDLLRLFATELLAAEDGPAALETARDRIVAHHVAALPDPADAAAARAWLGAEWDNVVVVADRLAATGSPDLQVLADRLVADHELPTPWDGWRRIQSAALAAAQRSGDRARTAALRQRIAIALRERRLLPEALARLAGAEEDFRAAGDGIGAAGAIGNEAEILRDLREDDRAAARFADAIALLGDHDGDDPEAVLALGWAWHGLGDVRCHQARHADALAAHRTALRHFRAGGNGLGEAWAWHGTGDALRARGRPHAAIAAYRRSLAAHAALGNVAYAGWTEQNLAETLLEVGDPDGAGPRMHRALDAAVARADPWSHARARAGLGDLARVHGDPVAAQEHWRAARDLLGDLDPELARRLTARISGT